MPESIASSSGSSVEPHDAPSHLEPRPLRTDGRRKIRILRVTSVRRAERTTAKGATNDDKPETTVWASQRSGDSVRYDANVPSQRNLCEGHSPRVWTSISDAPARRTFDLRKTIRLPEN